MWEATRTWHCSNCDTQLYNKDAECWYCYNRLYVAALKAVIAELSPDHPILKGLKVEWDEDACAWKETK